MSDSLWLYGLQHAGIPCPSPSQTCSNSSWSLMDPSSQWCHPTISSSVVPFSHLQSFPASESFQKSQFFASDGQIIGVSALTSVLPKNIQDWFPLGWWLVGSPCCPRNSQESSPTPQFKRINSSALSFLNGPTLIPYETTGKAIALTRWTFVGRVMSLLFNMLSQFSSVQSLSHVWFFATPWTAACHSFFLHLYFFLSSC